MLTVLEVNGSKICHLTNPGVYTGEYHNYCVGLFVVALGQRYLEEPINIILGDIKFDFGNSNRTLRFDIQSEHTLVKLGGRSVDEIVWGDVDTPDGSGKYLVRIPNYGYYSSLDGTIEYSLPNIANIKTNAKFEDYIKTAAYVAPVLYTPDFRERPRTKTITMFSSNPSPRRSEFFSGALRDGLDIVNVQNVFSRKDLQQVYHNSIIMVNVHQTDHHHTLEELRILPALCNGVVVVSEDVPLKDKIPYSDSVIWSSYADLAETVRDVQDNYAHYYESIFNSELEATIKRLHVDNVSNLVRTISDMTA